MDFYPKWHVPATRKLALLEPEIHVWRALLNLPGSSLDQFWSTLSSDERLRARSYHFEEDRRRFISARGHLRAILSLYLGIEPEQLVFTYGTHGKPELAAGLGEGKLRFNLSHSRWLALYGIACGRLIGIDLEYLKPIADANEIADRFFSENEKVALGCIPADRKEVAFYTCWTRKEAYIKARGGGLSIPLDQFDVNVTPGELPRLLSVQWDPEEVSRWSLSDLAPGNGFVGALAVEGFVHKLRCWQWT